MGNSGRTIWENVIIFILIGVACIFLTPIIQNIVFKSQVSAAETNINELISKVSMEYSEKSLLREVFLPFMMEFNENGTYDIYESTTKIANNQLLDNGKAPEKGQVILNEKGQTEVKNIVYGDITCNKKPKGDIKCVRKTE